MAMTNFRDLSSVRGDSPGFQFEFFCEVTGETWKSPFRPYRRGQLYGAVSKLTYWFNQLHSASRVTEHLATAARLASFIHSILRAEGAQRIVALRREMAAPESSNLVT